MTWISTVIYFQLSDLISKDSPPAPPAPALMPPSIWRPIPSRCSSSCSAPAASSALRRHRGLLLNPIIMVMAFLAVAFSPVLMVLGTIQVVRRFAEYAIAKPSRDMLFTVVDQQAKYKAKNVIDTVVYRFGDLTSAWLSARCCPSVWPVLRDGAPIAPAASPAPAPGK
jgi:ATP:ADP antiporter, AAA family